MLRTMPKLTFTIPETAKMSSLSGSYLYKLIGAGYLSEKRGEVKYFDPDGRKHYLITLKGIEKLTGTRPFDISDYLDELAKRLKTLMENDRGRKS